MLVIFKNNSIFNLISLTKIPCLYEVIYSRPFNKINPIGTGLHYNITFVYLARLRMYFRCSD